MIFRNLNRKLYSKYWHIEKWSKAATEYIYQALWRFWPILTNSPNYITGCIRKSGEEMLDHHCCGKDNFQNSMSNSLNNENSPLMLQSKRKREAFPEQEQEVCLTPGLFASPESSLLNENQLSPMNINAVPSVESIATVAQVQCFSYF